MDPMPSPIGAGSAQSLAFEIGAVSGPLLAGLGMRIWNPHGISGRDRLGRHWLGLGWTAPPWRYKAHLSSASALFSVWLAEPQGLRE
jgi:hypothetical protein